MARRPLGGNVQRLTMPLRAMVNRFAFLLLLGLGVGLLIAGKADIVAIERVRTLIVDGAAPVLEIAAQPVQAARRLIARVQDVAHVYEENRRLKAQNARLLRWQQVARGLEQDNAHFRRLLNVQATPGLTYISGRVIADTGGPFVRTLIVNAGLDDGVRRGQAVVSEYGLIGRVADVGRRSARILLLTDLNSRLPVVLESSRNRGILAGDNSTQPRLEFLPAGAQVSPGDRVVTSGQGGLLPAALPIGVVGSVDDGGVRVQPFADWDRLEIVSIIRFDALEPPLGEDRGQ